MKTKVKILYNKKTDDLFAFFPEDNYNYELYGNDMKTAYSHVGQHSGCRVEYAEESISATIEQSKPLIDELISLGYDLEIV